jgi:hypothetical protein
MADVNKEIALKVVATDATGPALQSLEDKLNAAKKRMVELAAAGKQNTEEFIRLQQEAGEFKRTIEGVEQSVDSVAKSGTQGMQLFGEAVTAVTAGFTIATSVTALYGEENEELQKNIMRVQAAMAILQSVTALVALTNKTSALTTTANRIALSLYDKTVKGTTISLKAFKVALATSGIGLIAVGAALAYENWDKLRQLLGLPPDNSKAIQALEREIAVLEAMGASVELLNEKKITLINLQAEQMKGQEKLNKLNEIDVLNASNSLRIKTANVALDEKSIEVTQQELELLLQKAGYLADVVKESQNLETATKTLTLTSESSFSEIIKKAQELHKEQTNNYYARRALAQSEQEQQAIDAEEAMRLLKLQNDLEKSLFEIKKRDTEEFNNFFRKERDTELNALEYEASQKTLLLQNERATKLAEAALALGDTEDFRKKQLEINQLYDDLQTTQDEITAEKRKELKKQERDTTLKFANEAFTGVLGFIAATQGQSEADARKAFNLNKAAGIADATVNTFLGASQALRDPKLPTLAKAFAVAGIIASGLTQVRKIAATQFQGGGGGSSVPSPALGGASMTPPPTFTNPQTTMLGNQGESIPSQGQQNQPMRAYVVERDIQQTTSRVRRLSEFATLG